MSRSEKKNWIILGAYNIFLVTIFGERIIAEGNIHNPYKLWLLTGTQ
jgi:hypothetical protein